MKRGTYSVIVEWAIGRIFLIKNGTRGCCKNHCEISLITTITRVLTSTILSRFTQTREDKVRGFRPRRRCINQIFILCRRLRTRHTHHTKVEAFLDLKEAFESVEWTTPFNFLHRKGIPRKVLIPLQHCTRMPEVYNEQPSSFGTVSRIRKKCPIISFDFNSVTGEFMKNASWEHQDGGVQLLHEEKLVCPNNLTCLLESAERVGLALNGLATAAAQFFASGNAIAGLEASNSKLYTRWRENNDCEPFRLPWQLHGQWRKWDNWGKHVQHSRLERRTYDVGPIFRWS